MKKIINGKRYDTETAKCLLDEVRGEFFNSHSDLHSLYVKKTGEYFSVFEGLPRSGDQNIYLRITPLSEHDARSFVEQWDNEEYEEIFGPAPE